MADCSPSSKLLYVHKGNNVRTTYYSSLDIQWSSDLYWKVHLGDVVAISTHPLSLDKIENWSPDHYKRESKHWKIGLVLGLAQVATPKSQTLQCTVQYLEKILDTPFAKEKQIKKTFRPWVRAGVPAQMPHVLVNTTVKDTVTPDLLLPVQIQMLPKKDFMRGIVDDDNRNLKFCCMKQLLQNNTIAEANPDPWIQLNADVPSSSSQDIPEPLKEAWLDWKVAEEIADLLVHLRDGFKVVRNEKKKERRRQILLAAAKEQEEIAAAESEAAATITQSNNKRKHNSKAIGGGKRVRIQIPGTENIPPKQQQQNSTKQTKSVLKRKDSSKQGAIKAVTTPKLKTKSANTSKAKAKRKNRASLDTASTATTVASGSTRSTTSTRKQKRQSGSKKKTQKATTKVQEQRIEDVSTKVTPIGDKMMTCQFNDYYDSVSTSIDYQVFSDSFEPQKKRKKRFELSIGQIVAVMVGVRDEDEESLDNEPFDEQIQWSTAQIVAIYFDPYENDWYVSARWFYRSNELKSEVRKWIEEDPGFSTRKGVIEGLHVDEIPMDSVLPTHVQVSSEYSWHDNNPITKHTDGLPIIHLSCRHLQSKDENKIVELKSDWNKYHDKLCSIPEPLERGLASIKERKVAKKYKTVLSNRSRNDLITESSSTIEMVVDYTPASLSASSLASNGDSVASNESTNFETGKSKSQRGFVVNPLTVQPLYERWERKFYDGIRLEIVKKALVKTIRPKTQQWTIRVGYVVPVEVDKTSVQKGTKAQSWYPFVRPWCAAQIISIFKKEDEWMIQIRWFNRFYDLLERQKKRLEQFDKPNILFETEVYAYVSVRSILPGRIILTSNEMDNWEVESSFLTGLPLIPRLCGHICIDDDYDNSLDWSNYDLTMNRLPSPLTRGLLLESPNRENKEWIFMLSRYYKKAIKARGADVDEQLLRKWRSNEGKPIQARDSIIFEPRQTEVVTCAEIFTSDSTAPKHFYRTLRLSIPRKYIGDPRHLAKRKRSNVHCFSCKIGDVVCFYDKASSKPADHVLMKHIKNPWYPYQVPWSFGQILSFYSDAETGMPVMEIRRFYRLSDLPAPVVAFAPVVEDADVEDVFESDMVEDIPASHLLGNACVHLGHNSRSSNNIERMRQQEAIVSFQCKFFYLHSKKRIQPLYSSGLSPGPWFRSFQQRGLRLSKWAMKYPKLRVEALAAFFLEDKLDVSRLLGSASKDRSIRSTSKIEKDSVFNSGQRHFLADASLPPKWSSFDTHKVFYEPEDQDKEWKVKVGDFVAVRDEDSAKDSICYPFAVGWLPAQILSIFWNENKKETNNELQADFLLFEIRILNCCKVDGDGSYLPQIIDTVPPRTCIVKVEDLLGPLLVCPHDQNFESQWGLFQNHLPCAPCWGHKSLTFDISTVLQKSSIYNADSRNAILSALGGKEAASHSQRNGFTGDGSKISFDSGSAWTSTEPLHLDLSQLRSYYSKMNVLPSCQTKRIGIEQKLAQPWSVSMGDLVLIKCEGPRRYPMDCNWSVGEVVAMWKSFKSMDDMERNHHLYTKEERSPDDVHVEIRWFYERGDLQGKQSLNVDANDDTEELFETDHVDVVQGADILAPAILGSDTDSLSSQREMFMGVSIQKFLCNRFWSTTRKSLIPCGSLAGRQKRGWLYTKTLPVEAQQKLANIELPPVAPLPSNDMTWKESMGKIIGKLSLQDASKGAYERGEALIGREKELDQLMKFFRSAIRGDRDGSVGSKSSIFLAGAPGVGKTACIRSAIARLRHEQAKGEIPQFKFIPLNGMEMRHPFECYGRFWEALTGVKHTGSYKLAKERLISYFCDPAPLGGNVGSSVSVLLLDEIDYLISPTSDEDMLYDFFRWPQEAAEASNGRRLVVVGISNTLNLHEQLQRRVGSRLGFQKCIFRSYNINDTIAILKSKINEASPKLKIFEDDAILLASKKIAGLSGDIRKAFQICRAATELVLQKWETQQGSLDSYPKVRIGDVQKASRQLCNDGHARAISFLSSFEALLLISLASLCRTTGQEKGSFDIKDVMMKMEALAGASGHPQYSPAPSFSETLHLLNRLGELNLVGLQTTKSSLMSFRSSRGGSGGAWPLATLNADEVTILQGIKNTPHKDLAEKNLPCGY